MKNLVLHFVIAGSVVTASAFGSAAGHYALARGTDLLLAAAIAAVVSALFSLSITVVSAQRKFYGLGEVAAAALGGIICTLVGGFWGVLIGSIASGVGYFVVAAYLVDKIFADRPGRT